MWSMAFLFWLGMSVMVLEPLHCTSPGMTDSPISVISLLGHVCVSLLRILGRYSQSTYVIFYLFLSHQFIYALMILARIYTEKSEKEAGGSE